MDNERDVRWLLQRLHEEEDLRPPYRRQRERRWVADATVLRDGDGGITAYTELRKHLFAVELTTVVVDPLHRGKGLSHALVEAAVRAPPLAHSSCSRSTALERAVAEQVSCSAGFESTTLSSVGLRAAMRCGRMLLLGDLRKLARRSRGGVSMLGARRWKDGVDHSLQTQDCQTAQAGLRWRVQGRSEAFHVVR